MRQRMSERRTKQLAVRFNLPIVKVMVRGGTNHRKDLCLEDGTIICLWPDGILTVATDMPIARWRSGGPIEQIR